MTNELIKPTITTTPGAIKFDNFEAMKLSAQRLVDSLNQVEVTPESVKTAKKLRASVNGRLSELNTQRIAIKKDMEQPYDTFKDQLDEITSLVARANKTIDAQVKQLDQQERNAKARQLSTLYDEHHEMYTGVPFTADDFLKINPQVLNKSVSMNKAEEVLAQWLNDRDKDIHVIQGMSNAKTVLGYYKQNGGDLSGALTAAQAEQQREERAKKVLIEREPDKGDKNATFVFTVKGSQYGVLAELLMKNNGIPFNKEII